MNKQTFAIPCACGNVVPKINCVQGDAADAPPLTTAGNNISLTTEMINTRVVTA